MSEPNYQISQSRWLPALLGRCAQLGIEIRPFLVVREGVPSRATTITSDARFSVGFITEDDVPELVRIEPGVDAERCADRLRRGFLCYAVKDGTRIVAKMWCDLEWFSFAPNYRRLESHEVYLFNAYTDPTYRGQNLAPLMRSNCYAALREIGRDSFFSCTEYFNTSARRFKNKLGAIDESLRVHIKVFGRFSRTFTLWRYSTHA